MVYDPTTGYIDTPDGPGKFVEFDGSHGVVTVEMENRYLVFYPAETCFVREV